MVPAELEPLELDRLEDDDGWSEVEVRGGAVGADAERVAFTRSRLVGVRLAAARLHRPELTDVVLVDCDLAGAVLEEATLVRVSFERCRLSGADLGGAQLTDVRIVDGQLDDLGLRMVAATRLEVEGGSAARVDLYRARVPGSAWLGTDLTGADLSGADLARARLHGSTLVDLTGASALKGTVIAPDQTVAVGLALIGDAGITVDEDA
ncbi:MAG TPA: pentapeptide repeat-containing protein [Aquihabitans sp.]|nr:pentapeptide repeat-containing protein [Aquihabitans sp.]